MTNLDAASYASSSSSTSRTRRRRRPTSSYPTLCVILALSFISLLFSLLSFNGIRRTTLTILNRQAITTGTVNNYTPSADQPSLTTNYGVAARSNNAMHATSDVTAQQSVGNSTGSNSNTLDDDGMIELNTIEFDNELRRMVEERKKDGAQRGKIAWLMRYVRFGLRFYNSPCDGCACFCMCTL